MTVTVEYEAEEKLDLPYEEIIKNVIEESLDYVECHGHAKIRFSGSRRSHAEHDHLFPDQIDILLLSQCLRFYRFSIYGVTDDIAVQGKHFRVLILKGKSQCIIHILLPDLLAPLRELQKR